MSEWPAHIRTKILNCQSNQNCNRNIWNTLLTPNANIQIFPGLSGASPVLCCTGRANQVTANLPMTYISYIHTFHSWSHIYPSTFLIRKHQLTSVLPNKETFTLSHTYFLLRKSYCATQTLYLSWTNTHFTNVKHTAVSSRIAACLFYPWSFTCSGRSNTIYTGSSHPSSHIVDH